MSRSLARLLVFCALAFALSAHSQILLKEFRTDTVATGLGGRPRNFLTIGGTMYFSARSVNAGFELWKSDGTQAGTVMIKDINPGNEGSDPELLTNFNGQVLFLAHDGVHGQQLWISDGTTAGTRLVKAIEPGFHFEGTQIVVMNGVAYFRALAVTPDHVEAMAVWRTDGTADGTYLLKVGETSVGRLAVAGNSLYFMLDQALWKSDGTVAGTQPLMTVCSGSCFSSPLKPEVMGTLGDKLIFSAFDASGHEPWITDGTPAGTMRIADVHPSDSSHPVSIAVTSEALYFWANDPVAGREPWKTDGTPAGTSRVHDIEPGLFTSDAAQYPTLVPVVRGNKVFFTAHTSATGTELWVTDGTSAGTVRLTDTAGPTSVGITHLFAATSAVYFTTANHNLWKSDGTPAGTVLVRSVADSGPDSLPNDSTVAIRRLRFAELNGTVYLWGGIDGSAAELLRTDGTSAGTMLAADIHSNVTGGDVQQPTHLNGRVYFHATTTEHGTELWSTDGMTAGTTLLRDVNPGPASGTAGPFHPALGRIFFNGNDGVHGWQLWSTDGTTNGTQMIADVQVGPSGATAGNKFFFDASDGGVGRRLWVTDGTPAGTQELTTVCPSTCYGLGGLREFNGKLFFGASSEGTGLWISDGTEAGTIPLVLSDEPGGDPGALYGSVVYHGKLYALTSSGLWESDGTPQGTTKIKAVFGAAGSFIEVINDRIVFAIHVSGDLTLWTSDGTEAGTQQFLAEDGFISRWKKVGESIFYARAVIGSEGDQLWKTDGTAAGTVLVKTINPNGRSAIAEMTELAGLLYFQASDGVHGLELWRSDGTGPGTSMLFDLEPGQHGSAPGSLFLLGGAVHFAAYRSDVGRELWKICAPTTQFGIAVSSNSVAAGATLHLSATALTSALGVNSCYTGLVRFTSIDPAATLPADYSYTPADAGGRLFTLTLRTAGPRTITVRDVDDPSIAGSVTIEVTPGPIASRTISASPTLVLANQQSIITVQVRDAFGNGVPGETIDLSSTFGTLSGVTDAGNGNYTATLTAATDGDATITGSGITGSAFVHFTTDLNRKGDFDADGNADLLWRNGGTGQSELWRMDGATRLGITALPVIGGEWTIGGIADFDGNGRADLLWRRSDGTVAIWLMNGGAIASSATVATVPAEWLLQGAGDFTGDGRADLLWRNSNSSAAVVWTMNGTTITGTIDVAAPNSDWSLKAVGDFDGDRIADLLWYNHTNNHAVVWLMNGGTIRSAAFVAAPPPMWQVQGVGDFDADGKADLLWRNADTNQVVVWLMNGASISSTAYLASPPPQWTLGAISDFDGDRDADLVWRNTSTGENVMWVMNGTAIAQGVFLETITDQGWQMAGPR